VPADGANGHVLDGAVVAEGAKEHVAIAVAGGVTTASFGIKVGLSRT
jgi:hypothetical protein